MRQPEVPIYMNFHFIEIVENDHQNQTDLKQVNKLSPNKLKAEIFSDINLNIRKAVIL